MEKNEPPLDVAAVHHPNGPSHYYGEPCAMCTAPVTKPVKSIKKNILQEADEITSGDRRKAYGKVNKQLQTLAGLWAPILGKEPSMLQVALCLLQLKVSRELHQHSKNNITDIAGYARVIEMLFDGE